MPTSSASQRRQTDVMDLMMKDFKVEIIEDDLPFKRFNVEFHGPKDTPYEDGVWIIRVHLPPDYPFAYPVLSFENKIFHPNIDFKYGALCLAALGEDWRPVYDLVNVFEIFLPQFLSFPNPTNPYNLQAASLLERDKEAFEQKVREYCAEYAKKEDTVGNSSGADEEESDGSEEEEEKEEGTSGSRHDGDP